MLEKAKSFFRGPRMTFQSLHIRYRKRIEEMFAQICSTNYLEPCFPWPVAFVKNCSKKSQRPCFLKTVSFRLCFLREKHIQETASLRLVWSKNRVFETCLTWETESLRFVWLETCPIRKKDSPFWLVTPNAEPPILCCSEVHSTVFVRSRLKSRLKGKKDGNQFISTRGVAFVIYPPELKHRYSALPNTRVHEKGHFILLSPSQ